MFAGPVVVPRPPEVGAERLVVSLPRGLQGQGQAAVPVLQVARRQVRDDRLADPVVVRLDPLVLRGPAGPADEARGP